MTNARPQLHLFGENFFPRFSRWKSNGQRKKRGNTLFPEHGPLAREYDKEISRLPPLRSEKNGTSGSVEHVPGIGRRTSSIVEKLRGVRCKDGTCARTSKYFWKERLVRTRKAYRGMENGGDGGKSLAKGVHCTPRARGLAKRRRKTEEVYRVRCAARRRARGLGVVVRSFVCEGSVLGSRNMA